MVMGFGFLFKIDEESVKNRDLRRDAHEDTESNATDATAGAGEDDDVVLEVSAAFLLPSFLAHWFQGLSSFGENSHEFLQVETWGNENWTV